MPARAQRSLGSPRSAVPVGAARSGARLNRGRLLRPPLPAPASAPTRRVLRVFGTGQTLTDDDSLFIGTAIAPGGHLVWHLFEQGGTR